MVFIREASLPMCIRGFIMPDMDGNYNIYINDKLSEERRQITIEHELQHLKCDDCYCDLPVKVIESKIIDD
jgi:Zn-dependent peptidase ImmA (M78 family)